MTPADEAGSATVEQSHRGTAPQVFVVGSSRSGTTMMGRILNRHPLVFTFDELHFFEQAYQPTVPPVPIAEDEAVRLASQLLATQRQGYQQRGDGSQFEGEAKDLVTNISGPLTASGVYAEFIASEAASHGASIGCDQTPRNLYYLTELLELYPEAVAVVMVRDPRDVLLSQKYRWRRRALGATETTRTNALRTWAGYHPITISLLWRSGAAATQRFKAHPRVVPVRFEDLLADPERELRAVCEKVGIDFSSEMLQVPRIGSSSVADRPNETGIDPNAAGRWRNGLTDTEAWLCQKVTAQQMAVHGYTAAPVRPGVLPLGRSAVLFFVKSALAFALNARRAGNLLEAARRRLGAR